MRDSAGVAPDFADGEQTCRTLGAPARDVNSPVHPLRKVEGPDMDPAADGNRKGALPLHDVAGQVRRGPNCDLGWLAGFTSRPGQIDEYVATTGAVLRGLGG